MECGDGFVSEHEGLDLEKVEKNMQEMSDHVMSKLDEEIKNLAKLAKEAEEEIEEIERSEVVRRV